jgi:Mg2+ and Co2+ transporter CorA
MAEEDVSTPLLFDRDEVEHLGSLSERPKRLNGSTLLWVDVDRRTQASADEMAVVFDLEETTRRRLASSEGRAVFVTHPELEALGNDGSGERFQSLLLRFESTVQEARDARESTVGSFDVLIARTGHRTNHIMKVLTLTSEILLPGALIAGVMGMNFKVSVFEDSWMFYVVLAVILALAPLAVAIARTHDWIKLGPTF